MIKTIEELAALPPDTVVLEENGFVTDAESAAWHAEVGYEVFPATVLIPATISRDTLSLVRGTLFDFGVTEKYMDRAVDALLVALGLEVSDD